MLQATFDADGIIFSKYPFTPASVYPHGRIAYSAIRDADPSAAPPEVRTNAGETLFVSAEQSDDFRKAIADIGLVTVRRVDIWSLLLEPFLDTEFTAEQHQSTIAMLESLDISRAESSRIRRTVKHAMLAYNALHWDWIHLGLYDVLTAMRQMRSWTSLTYRLFPSRYGAFYRDAMELADRGRHTNFDVPAEGKANF